MSRQISQVGIDLIKSFEGCRLTAYKPVPTETYYTIGYGHYGPDVSAGMKITQEQAEQMLVSDLGRYVAPVNNPAYVPFTAQLNQNQFDALVSFCYNCGAGNLKGLCAGRTRDEIPDYLPLYNKGGGNVLAGLFRRRKDEVDLYLKEDEEDMAKIEELEEKLEAAEQRAADAEKRLAAIEERLNVSGNQNPPEWTNEAVAAAKKAGLIKTSQDKGHSEFIMIQIMHNSGLTNPEAIEFLKNYKG